MIPLAIAIGIIEDKIANDLTSKDTKARECLEDVKAKISRHKPTSIQDYIQKSIGELATKKDLTMAQAVVSYSQILMTIYRMEINNDIQNNRNTDADTDLV